MTNIKIAILWMFDNAFSSILSVTILYLCMVIGIIILNTALHRERAVFPIPLKYVAATQTFLNIQNGKMYRIDVGKESIIVPAKDIAETLKNYLSHDNFTSVSITPVGVVAMSKSGVKYFTGPDETDTERSLNFPRWDGASVNARVSMERINVN